MRNLDQANAALAAQARLSRELSQRLMGVRMVPFESLAERLHRVVRQAAKDTGKRANLDIRQGQTELDRSVLDKMAGPLEHMLRNSVGPRPRRHAGRTPPARIRSARSRFRWRRKATKSWSPSRRRRRPRTSAHSRAAPSSAA
jgi:chemosensory pili system protein ChpA (sensor histidine kinase/response regulator)